MKLRLLALAIFVFSIFSYEFTLAQDAANPIMPEYKRKPVFMGPVFGYNRPFHTANIQTFANDDLCPIFETGQDNGFFVGFSYEHFIGDFEVSTSSIIVRVLYNTFPALFEVSGDNKSINVIVGNNEAEIPTIVDHKLEVNYSVFTAEAVYKINPFPGVNLGFTAGPTFDFAIASDQVQSLNLLEPNNAYFRNYPGTNNSFDADGNKYTNNGRTLIPAGTEGDVLNASEFRFGLKLGIQYEIFAGERFYIVPNFNYNLGITNFNSDYDWRVSPFQFGVDIRFSIFGSGN